MRDYDGDFRQQLAGYPASPDDIDRMMHDLAKERQRMIKEGTSKAMDPKDEQLVSLAHEAGEMKALFKTSDQKCKDLEKTIEKLESKVNDLEGIQLVCDQWRERAEKAEATLKRSRSARRR